VQHHVDRIRQDYTKDLKSKVMLDRQRATAMYFIDRLALRAGNEKGDDEADTVGCCSLRCEHVTLQPPNHLVFDFKSTRTSASSRITKRTMINSSTVSRYVKTSEDNVLSELTRFTDWAAEQAQRVYHVPATIGPRYARKGDGAREAQCVQSRQSYGGHSL